MSELQKRAAALKSGAAATEAKEKEIERAKRDNLFLKFAKENTTIAIAGVVVLGVMVLAAIGVGMNGVVQFIEEKTQQLEYVYRTFLSAEADMDELCPAVSGYYLEKAFYNNANVFMPIRDALTPPVVIGENISNLNREGFVDLINPFAEGAFLNDEELAAANAYFNSDEMKKCTDYKIVRAAFENWAEAFINLDFALAQQYAREFDEWSLYLVGSENFKLSLMQLNQAVFQVEDPSGYKEFLNEQTEIKDILNTDLCALLGKPFSSATEFSNQIFYCSAVNALVEGGEVSTDENGFPLGYWSLNNAFLGE